jgi:hypothetical protein
LNPAPIDLLVLTVGNNAPDEAIPNALRDLMRDGTIEVIDFLVVAKDTDGNGTTREWNDLDEQELKHWAPLVSRIDGILSSIDAEQLKFMLPNETTAVMLVIEDVWAAKLRARMQGADGDLLLFQRIPRVLVGSTLQAVPTGIELVGLEPAGAGVD